MKLPLDLGTRAKVTTRTPAASERGGLLVPLISGLGGQRQHLWLLPATQDVLGMRKHEVGAKGADDRDACGQLDGRSSLNLPSTPDDTTSAAYVFASARAIWQGTNRERERALARTATHLPSSEERRQAARGRSGRGAQLRSHPGHGHLPGHLRHLRRCRRRGGRSRVGRRRRRHRRRRCRRGRKWCRCRHLL